ncbi:MAG: hypothetical protein H6641_26405 [Caldilineaceae bacterium]|nr:hypothetical protein [Caldilineaceae bacterium]
MSIAQVCQPNVPIAKKVGAWARRYAPSEAVGTLAALMSAMLAAGLGANAMFIALAGAWGEVFGFYLPLLVREFMTQQHAGPLSQALWRTLRNLLLEFGAAELLDTGLMRPALMTAALQLIPQLSIAIVVGKLAADIFFYGLAIMAYELRQKLMAS